MPSTTRKHPRKNSSKRGPKKPRVNPFWEDFIGQIFGRNGEYRPAADHLDGDPRSRNEPPPSPMETAMLTEMLREGYKVLAKRYHPDLETGDAEKMTELNRIKAELKF